MPQPTTVETAETGSVAADMPLIGKPLDRSDARAKVTGAAKYTADFLPPNLAHAVLVQSTMAKATVKEVNVAAARSAPGVVAVFSYDNGPKARAVPSPNPKSGSSQSPGVEIMLKSADMQFVGQDIAVVVAETLEQAEYAARLVKVTYEPGDAVLGLAEHLDQAHAPSHSQDKSRGDVEKGLAASAVKIEATYTTPNENHNPMETHATVAVWDGEKVTVYDSTQTISGSKASIARALNIPPADIRVISYYLGGGFGCKGNTWPHVALTVAAARQVGRPVKLSLSRHQMFTSVGRRAHTVQKFRAGAAADGKLLAISHDVISQSATYAEFVETSTLPTGMLYACPNVSTTQKIVKINEIVPTYQRAPGESTGNFALESVMDELAYALKMDPLKFRLINYAETDPEKEKPWSSKSLKQCYQQAAEHFGWDKRTPEPRSMRQGNTFVGWGMGTASYPANQHRASAKVHLYADGTAVVESASQDLGTGTYTIMAQIVAETLGLPIEKVRSRLGDSLFPPAGVSGGSSTAAGVGNAVRLAAENARQKLAELAVGDVGSPLHGLPTAALKLSDGRLTSANDSSKSESVSDLLARNKMPELVASFENSQRDAEAAKKYTMQAFGAVFVEVHVDADLGTIHVPRIVAAYAAGRILNAKTARSQFLGGLVWGISMATHEETRTDLRTGQIVNSNLADYLVPVNADIGSMDIIMVQEDDPHLNAIGVKGIGEIGITGGVGAIANAVFHATGKRVRDLPITLDKLI